MKTWMRVLGADLQPGMKIYPVPDFNAKVETVGPIKGRCEKGMHFGSGCYDRISTWWVFE